MPLLGVESVVMVLAQGQQSIEIGMTTAFPVVEVVWLRGGDVSLATRDGAASVHRPQRTSLMSICESSAATSIKSHRALE